MASLQISEVGVAESAYDVFAPEAVYPEQFYGIRERGLRGGERRLMAAVLADGVEAYVSYWLDHHKHLAEDSSDVVDWVEIKDSSYVFSFDVVCESLGIDPDYLRLGLKRFVETVRSSENNERSSAWQKIRRPRV